LRLIKQRTLHFYL